MSILITGHARFFYVYRFGQIFTDIFSGKAYRKIKYQLHIRPRLEMATLSQKCNPMNLSWLKRTRIRMIYSTLLVVWPLRDMDIYFLIINAWPYFHQSIHFLTWENQSNKILWTVYPWTFILLSHLSLSTCPWVSHRILWAQRISLIKTYSSSFDFFFPLSFMFVS